MSPSPVPPSSSALSDVTNGPQPVHAPLPTPRKPAPIPPSVSPPDTPVTPRSPPYVTAASTPAAANPDHDPLRHSVPEHHNVVRNAFANIQHQASLDHPQQQAHPPINFADPQQAVHLHVTDDTHEKQRHELQLHSEHPHSKPQPEPPHPVESNINSHLAIEHRPHPEEQLTHFHPSVSQQPYVTEPAPDPEQKDPIPSQPGPTFTNSCQVPDIPIESNDAIPDIASLHAESLPHEHTSLHPLTDTYPPLSDSASHNSPPTTPPRANPPVPAGAWTHPTRPRSPNLRLAAAAAMRASMAPVPAPTAPSKKSKKNSVNPHGPFQATRPVSPKFRLVAAAAARAAAMPPKPPAPKPKKPQPEWGTTKTVPKSPKLRCAGKALSMEAAARKAALLAEEELQETEIRLRLERLRASHATWASTRTMPKSPAVLRRPTAHAPETGQKKRFTPTPLPDFGQAPPVKQTRASVARLQSRKGVQKVMPAKPPQQRPVQPLGRTVPCPFSLQGVSKHEEVVENLQRRQQLEEAETRRSRIFEPVPLREEILEGPTFVPVHDDSSRTDPVSLIPDAEERSRRTQAYLASQRERIEEMEQRKIQAARDREEREMEDAEREWQLKRFKPRPVPKSHYKPHILPVGSVDGPRSVSTDIGLLTPSSQVAEGEEQATPAQENREGVPRRPSIFEGLRKSLSPLLGAPGAESVQQNGVAQQ